MSPRVSVVIVAVVAVVFAVGVFAVFGYNKSVNVCAKTDE